MWWCVWVRSSRPCISCLPWLSLFRLACVRFSCGFLSLCCGLFSFVAGARCFVVVVVFLLVALAALVLAVWPALSCSPPLPLVVSWCFLVQSVSWWSLPPDIWLYRNGPVVIPLVWRVVVDWLLFSLRSLATKASALCGLCPLHHVVGVVHVPLAPSLRCSPSCDPVYPSDTAKAARARLLGLCCFLPPVLLPSRASALSFLAGLRLSPSPRASFCWLCLPPCGFLSWLVLVAPPSVFLVCPLGVACFVVCLVSLCCSSLADFSVLCFCFWWLLLTSYWTGTLVYLISPAQLRRLSELDWCVCPQTGKVHLCC